MLGAALAVLGVARLRFDVEILNLLPDRLPAVEGLKVYQRHFSGARELVIAVESGEAEVAETAARVLAERLRARTNLVAGVIWQPSWLGGSRPAAELAAYLWLNQPPEAVRDLEHRLAVTNLPRVLAESRERLATSLSPGEIGLRGYDPLGLLQLPEAVTRSSAETGETDGPFVASDGRFRVLFVESAVDLAGYKACLSWLADLRRVVAEGRVSGDLPAGVEIHFTGRPVFVSEIAGGMESDLTGSSAGTLAIIAALFWLSHRRVRPLLGLLALLVLVLVGTLALGGLLLGTINVVSLGFAAMLLGLAEDFGIVSYQESRSHPDLSVSRLRREVAPGILWSAVTTAGAFALLNLSALPGLGQLGTLVALGIVLAALVMLFVYLPLLPRWRRNDDRAGEASGTAERLLLFPARRTLPRPVALLLTVLALAGSVTLLVRDGLRFDHSADVLKPRQSEAASTLELIQRRFGRQQEPIWVLVTGRDETEVARRLEGVERTLASAVAAGEIAGFTSPGPLWANPGNQRANRASFAALAGRREEFRRALEAAGFSPEAFTLSAALLETWQTATTGADLFRPVEPGNRWLLGKLAARTVQGPVALVPVQPADDPSREKRFLERWNGAGHGEGVLLSGWRLLGSGVFDAVVDDLPGVLVPIALLVLMSLGMAFRRASDVGWSLATIAFAGLCLGGAMNLLGWKWNLLNLTALPLLLGMGVDFGIHILLALRRQDGDRLAVHRSVGRALLLAGSTTVAGFASLAFSSNAGMASLGQVCALGIALALVTAVYLLPAWWACAAPRERGTTFDAAGRLRSGGRSGASDSP